MDIQSENHDQPVLHICNFTKKHEVAQLSLGVTVQLVSPGSLQLLRVNTFRGGFLQMVETVVISKMNNHVNLFISYE